MNKKLMATLLTLVVVGTVSAQKAPPPQKAAAPASDQAQIRAEAKAWFASKDAAEFSSYYAPDATLLPPNEKLVSGKAAITTYWTNFFKTPGLVLTGGPTHVEVAKSGDLAYDRGTFKLTVNGADGKPVTTAGKYVVVWKKQPDGKWKAYSDIFNVDTK